MALGISRPLDTADRNFYFYEFLVQKKEMVIIYLKEMTMKVQGRKVELFDNRSGFRGSGFKGFNCWNLLTIVSV